MRCRVRVEPRLKASPSSSTRVPVVSFHPASANKTSLHGQVPNPSIRLSPNLAVPTDAAQDKANLVQQRERHQTAVEYFLQFPIRAAARGQRFSVSEDPASPEVSPTA